MNREKLLQYIDDTQQKNKHFYTRKYFKIIKQIINTIEINDNLTIQAFLTCTAPFTQDYDIGKFGSYHIDFDIPAIIKMVNNDLITPIVYNNQDINFNNVYHEFPFDFNKNIRYNSKILITDFPTREHKLTVIDGNHTLEKYFLTKKSFNILHIPFYIMNRLCYVNDFSYFFHCLINELYVIFYCYQNNKTKQKKLIKSSKLFLIHSELA